MARPQNPFYQRRKDLETEEALLREEYTALLHEDPRYQQVQGQLKQVQEDCAKMGHKQGRFLGQWLGVAVVLL